MSSEEVSPGVWRLAEDGDGAGAGTWRPANRPLKGRAGYAALPGGSYRDLGAQLGCRSAGELADVAVGELMDAKAARRLGAQRAVMRVWRQMPRPWQAHAQGVTVKPLRVGRELMVYLDSSAWVFELSMRRDELVERWNALATAAGTPEVTVGGARFQLSRRAYAGGARNSLTVEASAPRPQRVPLSEAERGRVEGTCARITDERLRKRAQEAMTAILEWKKSKR